MAEYHLADFMSGSWYRACLPAITLIGTLEYNTAIISGISSTGSSPTMISQIVCCEKGPLV